jgi:hypothetical protein
MSMMWQCWTNRSTRAATQAAPGKMLPHCLKDKLVVIMWNHESSLLSRSCQRSPVARLESGRKVSGGP